MPGRTELEEMARILKSEGWAAIPPEQNLRDMDDDFLGIWESVRDFTMISPERGWALAEALRYVCRCGIEGDIVECGVWKGGACLLASHILVAEEPETPRRIWLYDTFTGMPSPGDEDKIASSGQLLSERNPEGWWAVGVNEVRQNLERSPLSQEHFRFIPGKVEDTLPGNIPEKLAVLRLDTDWYESTMLELEILYPRLATGGVLIVDDYGHFTGARKAVDEFFSGSPVMMHRSDYTGRVIVKN